MSHPTLAIGGTVFLPRSALRDLVTVLRKRGFTVIGPTQVEGVVALRPLTSGQELPRGVRDEQGPGHYRLVPGEPDLSFEYVVGPDSPKRKFFPPVLNLFQFHVDRESFVLDAGPPQVPKLAFLGVRPCELAAIKVQDHVFGADDPRTVRCESETYYCESRRESFLVAVNCTRPGGTCFCASMETGPAAKDGFDLALTELRQGFITAVGSVRGLEICHDLPVREPSGAELELAELKLHIAHEHMGCTLDTQGLKDLLDQSLDHPQWADVAKRCLSCGNCTMVCPTCFCSTVSDSTELAGPKVMRTRRWESCFTHQFSATTAGPVRNTIRGRYRHWLRHKLGTWWDQFGMSGCVGCGRCITWCPVGIDLTAEAAQIRAHSQNSVPPVEEAPV